jgi:myo-inositol-1(or 4)-monophosphatase
MRGSIQPTQKAPKDLVTQADFASQKLARDLIREAFPHHRFIGEEDDQLDGPLGAPACMTDDCWIVDPLDGTLNYVRQMPNYSVSVALARAGEVLVGTVYDPVLDECFSAESGRGAFLNGARINPSLCSQLDQALVAASLPSDVARNSPEIQQFIEVIYRAQAIRRLGSAALSLCYVACGRLDAYWATCVKSWDVAAGQLLVREAGGTLTRPDGTPFRLDQPQFAAAATTDLHQQLIDCLRQATEIPPVHG